MGGTHGQEMASFPHLSRGCPSKRVNTIAGPRTGYLDPIRDKLSGGHFICIRDEPGIEILC